MAFLEVKNVTKKFGDLEVLRGVSFSLEEGEVLSLIGYSGGGKTTLLRCLNFLETPDGGKVTVGGETVLDADMDEKLSMSQTLRRQIKFGMVFQQFNLFPHYNVKKNLVLAAELREKAAWKERGGSAAEWKQISAEVSERADALLHTVGLTEKAASYPCELSGGQQQRVAIARALMLSPAILCFDEPTSALDPELTGEVLRVIRSLKDEKRTMIIVTHEIAFAKSVSDKIIFMADGVIEEMGTPEQVIDAPEKEKTRAFLSATMK